MGLARRLVYLASGVGRTALRVERRGGCVAGGARRLIWEIDGAHCQGESSIDLGNGRRVAAADARRAARVGLVGFDQLSLGNSLVAPQLADVAPRRFGRPITARRTAEPLRLHRR